MRLALEVDAETEFNLPRVIVGRRGSDYPKGSGTPQREVWRAQRDMVQHVCRLHDEHHAEPLAESKVLCDRHVQIPTGQIADNASPAGAGVRRKGIPEHIVYSVRVG